MIQLSGWAALYSDQIETLCDVKVCTDLEVAKHVNHYCMLPGGPPNTRRKPGWGVFETLVGLNEIKSNLI